MNPRQTESRSTTIKSLSHKKRVRMLNNFHYHVCMCVLHTMAVSAILQICYFKPHFSQVWKVEKNVYFIEWLWWIGCIILSEISSFKMFQSQSILWTCPVCTFLFHSFTEYLACRSNKHLFLFPQPPQSLGQPRPNASGLADR